MLAPCCRSPQTFPIMRQLNAFTTPEYPILFDVIPSGNDAVEVPGDDVGVALALLVKGIPSFLAIHTLPEEEVPSLVGSLESGDVRLSVVGLPVQMKNQDQEPAHHPAAFVSLLCADGRRVTVARIVGSRAGDPSAEKLARHVTRQITRGVQISDLESMV